MIKKACLILMTAMSPVPLLAGVTMVTQTTTTSSTCNFRVDKCETSVATDPAYVHYTDGSTISPTGGRSGSGDPTKYETTFTFVDYSIPRQPTVEELVALIRSKLSNCPEVTMAYDADSGNITIHYLNATCDCNCDWIVNVRNVKNDDFVWKRTSDNYSPHLGQMERRQFHTRSEQDAQAIQTACAQICKINNWDTYK
jgi:hypothetical protein